MRHSRVVGWSAVLGLALLSPVVWGYQLMGPDWSWQANPVEDPFYIQSAGFPSAFGTPTEWATAYEVALDTWTTQSGADLVLISGGTTTTGGGGDGTQVAYYAPFTNNRGTLAVATTSFMSGTDIVECDIVFYGGDSSGTYAWSTDPAGAGQGEYDFAFTAVHEVGHCIGFDHSQFSSAVMYYAQSPGTDPTDRALSNDDKAGAQDMYGIGSASVLIYDSHVLVDDGSGASVGDGDGFAGVGETFELFVDVANVGTASATGVSGTLTTTAADLTIVDNTDGFGTVLTGSTATGSGGFAVAVDPGCLYDFSATFQLALADASGGLYYDSFAVDVFCGGPPQAILEIDAYGIDDDNAGGSSGDGDAIVEPGESIQLPLRILNAGFADATNISGTVTTTDPRFTITDPTQAFPDAAVGMTSLATGDFDFDVQAGCTSDYAVDLEFEFTAAVGGPWYDTLPIYVSCPNSPTLTITQLVIDDDTGTGTSVGNGDGVVHKGERVELFVEVQNTGTAPASGVAGLLSSSDPLVTVPDGDESWPNLAVSETQWSTDAFDYQVDVSCTTDYTVELDLDLVDAAGGSWPYVLQIPVVCDPDYDYDGFPVSEDCDDNDNTIWPGQVEYPDDGVDQDCNGFDRVTCWIDGDGDGFGSLVVVYNDNGACDPAASQATNANDCDDTDPAVNGGIPEIPDNGIDEDCNGVDTVSCWEDRDKDGYGDEAKITVYADDGVCHKSQGESLVPTDCDDDDATVSPVGTEILDDTIDQDCSGTDSVSCWPDSDQDGYGSMSAGVVEGADGQCDVAQGESSNQLDCNDSLPTVNPDATEVPDNGRDDDCLNGELCPVDGDNDGYRPDATTMVADNGNLVCIDAGEGQISDPIGDCNDADGSIHPNAADAPNDGVDQDCSGTDTVSCYRDADLDGFGSKTSTVIFAADGTCDATQAESAVNTDCNDFIASVNPGATEVPANGLDENCDGAELCYLDADSDGWRPDDSSTVVDSGNFICSDAGEARSTDPTGDCDDDDPAVRPNATEIPANGKDDNCDTEQLCWLDADDDGYRPDATATVVDDGDGLCTATGEAETTDPTTDCNDANPAVHPGITEVVANGLDDDCNGDELCWLDDDDDGYRPDLTSFVVDDGDKVCTGPDEALDTEPDGDCDDTDATIYPGAPEIPGDGIDQNCDSVDTLACYADSDGDGFGDGAVVLPPGDGDCLDAGESANGSDCDDTKSDIYPGAPETAGDGIDQDCNSVDAALCYPDVDGDTYGDRDASAITTLDGSCDFAQAESADNTDCDDAKADHHPGAPETPEDGFDQDCNGVDAITCPADADQDGHGAADGTRVVALDGTCDTADGEGTNTEDCDDSNPAIYPFALETPGDGIDQDCNSVDAVACWTDGDGDTYGDPAKPLVALDGTCDASQSESGLDTDCDDASGAIHPGAADIPNDTIDQDCNGVDAFGCILDNDGDGYGTIAGTVVAAPDGTCDAADGESSSADDCDDDVFAVHPTAVEIADDGIDQDCNNTDTITCYLDGDGDGHAGASYVLAPDASCDPAQDEYTTNTDCNDSDATISPDGTDIAGDTIDQDCSGNDAAICIIDGDQDGHGQLAGGTVVALDGTCDALQGEATLADDCNDGDATIHPGATEIAGDSIDQDCNNIDGVTCNVDFDKDGFGSTSGATVVAPDGNCDTIDGEATNNTDCDDSQATVNPDAPEICDVFDNDCDRLVNEPGAIGETTWYWDLDEDGYGDPNSSTTSCFKPTLAVSDNTDCDDDEATVHPGATEVCDDMDTDCDGTGDLNPPTWYADADSDGFGDPNTSVDQCVAPSGYASSSTDCDDGESAVNPDATEVCNGRDDDCDLQVDEGVGSETWYADSDGDGYGDPAVSEDACVAPSGYVSDDADCDDADATVNPGASEDWYDGVDDDCDGNDDDQDGDGHPVATDCDDTDATIVPEADGTCRTGDRGGGCGCASSGSGAPALGWGVIGLLAVWRRRRR